MEEKYEKAFELIGLAGDSKSDSMLAVEEAAAGRFEKAEEYVTKAAKKLSEAHGVQTDMLTEECNGKTIDMNIILVHAQDHLTMAMLMKEHAEEFIRLYRMIYELKEKQSL